MVISINGLTARNNKNNKHKKVMAKAKKLEIEKNENPTMAVALFQATDSVDIPKNAVKLNLPPMVKPDSIPVGSVLAGEILKVADSVSPRPEMKDAKLVHCRHASGTEYLLPLTGVIRKAIGGVDGVEKNIGRILIVKRLPDSQTTKYSGKNEPAKRVFMFDVYLAEA